MNNDRADGNLRRFFGKTIANVTEDLRGTYHFLDSKGETLFTVKNDGLFDADGEITSAPMKTEIADATDIEKKGGL